MFGEVMLSDNSEISLNWSENCTSWLNFKGALENLGDIVLEEFSPSLDDFCLSKVLGTGATGKVYACSPTQSKSEYALKKMRITDKHDDLDTIEYKEPSSVDDCYISFCFHSAWSSTYNLNLSSDEDEDCYDDDAASMSSDDDEFAIRDYLLEESRYVFIIMEKCSRTLQIDLPLQPREINVEDSWVIFENVTKAVQLIHHKGVIHRDLKPDNFFFGSNDVIKVGDMGHACWAAGMIGDSKGTPNRGTILYMAPELDEGPVTYKVDIYSLGIIFLDIFHSFSTVQQKKRVLEKLEQDVYTDWKGDSDFLRKLISLCPADRPSTEDILEYIAKRRSADD